jgi:hypothetical protein
MECSICYEKFIYPTSKVEFEKLFENYNNINYTLDKRRNFLNFMRLVITSRHNETIQCETPNCNSIICSNCWTKYTDRENESFDKFDNTLDKCPFCKQVYWKYYMKNIVHFELLMKVLNVDEFNEYTFKKMFPQFN